MSLLTKLAKIIRKRLMMSTEFVIELEESQIEQLKSEYGALLDVQSIIKEIVCNDLKFKTDIRMLKEETQLLNISAAKVNAKLATYERILQKSIDNKIEEDPELNVESVVSSVVRVGMDTQKVQTQIKSVVSGPATNQLLNGDADLDPKVKKAMEEIRKRNKSAAARASTKKNSVGNGGIVASQ